MATRRRAIVARMGDLRLDAAEVRTLAQRAFDGAEAIDRIHWPTMSSDSLSGSAVATAASTSGFEDRVGDVAGALRTWAAAASSAAAALQQADQRHAGRLWRPR